MYALNRLKSGTVLRLTTETGEVLGDLRIERHGAHRVRLVVAAPRSLRVRLLQPSEDSVLAPELNQLPDLGAPREAHPDTCTCTNCIPF